MRFRIPWNRWYFWLLLMSSLLLLAALLMLQAPNLKSVQQRALGWFNEQSELQIDFQHFHWSPPLKFALEDLTVTIATDTVCMVQSAQGQLRMRSLLNGVLHLSNLEVQGAHLGFWLRDSQSVFDPLLTSSPDSTASEGTTVPFEIPTVQLDHVLLRDIRIHADVALDSLSGSTRVMLPELQLTDFRLDSINGLAGNFSPIRFTGDVAIYQPLGGDCIDLVIPCESEIQLEMADWNVTLQLEQTLSLKPQSRHQLMYPLPDMLNYAIGITLTDVKGSPDLQAELTARISEPPITAEAAFSVPGLLHPQVLQIDRFSTNLGTPGELLSTLQSQFPDVKLPQRLQTAVQAGPILVDLNSLQMEAGLQAEFQLLNFGISDLKVDTLQGNFQAHLNRDATWEIQNTLHSQLQQHFLQDTPKLQLEITQSMAGTLPPDTIRAAGDLSAVLGDSLLRLTARWDIGSALELNTLYPADLAGDVEYVMRLRELPFQDVVELPAPLALRGRLHIKSLTEQSLRVNGALPAGLVLHTDSTTLDTPWRNFGLELSSTSDLQRQMVTWDLAAQLNSVLHLRSQGRASTDSGVWADYRLEPLTHSDLLKLVPSALKDTVSQYLSVLEVSTRGSLHLTPSGEVSARGTFSIPELELTAAPLALSGSAQAEFELSDLSHLSLQAETLTETVYADTLHSGPTKLDLHLDLLDWRSCSLSTTLDMPELASRAGLQLTWDDLTAEPLLSRGVAGFVFSPGTDSVRRAGMVLGGEVLGQLKVNPLPDQLPAVDFSLQLNRLTARLDTIQVSGISGAVNWSGFVDTSLLIRPAEGLLVDALPAGFRDTLNIDLIRLGDYTLKDVSIHSRLHPEYFDISELRALLAGGEIEGAVRVSYPDWTPESLRVQANLEAVGMDLAQLTGESTVEDSRVSLFVGVQGRGLDPDQLANYTGDIYLADMGRKVAIAVLDIYDPTSQDPTVKRMKQLLNIRILNYRVNHMTFHLREGFVYPSIRLDKPFLSPLPKIEINMQPVPVKFIWESLQLAEMENE